MCELTRKFKSNSPVDCWALSARRQCILYFRPRRKCKRVRSLAVICSNLTRKYKSNSPAVQLRTKGSLVQRELSIADFRQLTEGLLPPCRKERDWVSGGWIA